MQRVGLQMLELDHARLVLQVTDCHVLKRPDVRIGGHVAADVALPLSPPNIIDVGGPLVPALLNLSGKAKPRVRLVNVLAAWIRPGPGLPPPITSAPDS